MQSTGVETRRVEWAQSSALLVRREAASRVGYLDPRFFVYYDECDFAKRLADAGWHALFVPDATASTTTSSPPTSPPGCRGSSNSTATATSTCACTTAPARPARCAG